MAVTINASTSAGLVQTADTSGVLQLQTASTTAVTVNASQNVGIGTTSPAVKLDVVGAMNVSGNVNIGSSANGGQVMTTLQGYSPNSTNGSYGNLLFSANGNYTGGASRFLLTNAFNATDFAIISSVNATTTPTLDSGGAVSSGQVAFSLTAGGNAAFTGNIGIGGATPTTSGTGITFPATQSASSNANTLDDYEEGTWTPAFTFSTSGSVTYTTQAGYYRKVGSLVFVESNIIIASVSSPTGNVTVNNLPFTVSSSTENVGSLSTGIIRNLVNAKPDIKAYCSSGSTQIIFPVNDTISGSSELQGSDLKASTLIYVSGCFIAN